MRERPVAWITLTERRSPWLISTELRPRLLTVIGRSIATRAGFVTEKFVGATVSGSLSWIGRNPAALGLGGVVPLDVVGCPGVLREGRFSGRDQPRQQSGRLGGP